MPRKNRSGYTIAPPFGIFLILFFAGSWKDVEQAQGKRGTAWARCKKNRHGPGGTDYYCHQCTWNYYNHQCSRIDSPPIVVSVPHPRRMEPWDGIVSELVMRDGLCTVFLSFLDDEDRWTLAQTSPSCALRIFP